MDVISKYRLAEPRSVPESQPGRSRLSISAASVGISDSSLFSETSTVVEPEELEEDREDIQKLDIIRATALEHQTVPDEQVQAVSSY